MVDNYPVVSQVKSLVQVSCGDVDGARATQQSFVNETPVFGDVTYFLRLATGDSSGARSTRHLCNKAWSRSANAIPIVGHVKSAVHYSLKDNRRASEAFRSANRATIITTAALMSGPFAPVAVVASALGYDAVDSLISGHGKGVIGTVQRAVDEPSPGSIYDALVAPALHAAPTPNPIKMAMK